MSWAALAAAGVGAAATVGGSVLNAFSAADANKKNEQLAREQMAFQNYMSSTAFERASKDMKKAGLNPMLPGINQSSASSPQGASPTIQSTRAGDALINGTNSALSNMQLVRDWKATDSQIALQKSQELTQIADAKLKDSSAVQVQQMAKNAATEGKILKADARKKEVTAEVDRAHAEIDKENAKYDNWLKRIDNTLGTVGTGLDAINPVRWLRKKPSNSTPSGGGMTRGSHDPRDYYKNLEKAGLKKGNSQW